MIIGSSYEGRRQDNAEDICFRLHEGRRRVNTYGCAECGTAMRQGEWPCSKPYLLRIEAEINSGSNTNVTGIEGHLSVRNGAFFDSPQIDDNTHIFGYHH
jgi:hypothetical protein